MSSEDHVLRSHCRRCIIRYDGSSFMKKNWTLYVRHILLPFLYKTFYTRPLPHPNLNPHPQPPFFCRFCTGLFWTRPLPHPNPNPHPQPPFLILWNLYRLCNKLHHFCIMMHSCMLVLPSGHYHLSVSLSLSLSLSVS